MSAEELFRRQEATSMADANRRAEAGALFEVAKMLNDLRNAVVLLGLVIGRDKGPDAGTNARDKLEELATEEGLLKVTAT
jgi:hypothetical protein